MGPHNHSNLETIKQTIDSLGLPENIKTDVLNIYKIIADAESAVHGEPVEAVHFHEVGTKDAIMDIAAACLLIRTIDPDKIYASPVCTGSGFVRCAHGYVPVPAPATALILEGIPNYQGDERGELCTPTGAAILKYFVDEFRTQPLMRTEKTGYGFGKKDFKKLNCLRASLGTEVEDIDSDTVLLLQCNLDDMTGEEAGYAVEKLLELGALDVYTTPIYMKKNRPGILLSVLVKKAQRQRFVHAIFKFTTTIGIREFVCNRRYTLDRYEKEIKTELGNVHKKISRGYDISREKYEFEDLKRLAEEHGLSLIEIKELIKNSDKN